MSPRLKLRAAATPLVLVGALWAGSELWASGLNSGPRTPPPCSPDGSCLPRPQTYGWYQTRWRAFPGDVLPGPTVAEPETTTTPEGTLGGPQPPDPSKEGQVAPPRPERNAPAGADEAGVGAAPEGGAVAPPPGGGPAGAETPSGPLPGLDFPPAGDPAGGQPEADPLDPFGGAPPSPPAWLRQALGQPSSRSPLAIPGMKSVVEQSGPATAAAPAPIVTPAPMTVQTAHANGPAALVQPASVTAPGGSVVPAMGASAPAIVPAPAPTLPARVLDGPNLHSDDAPPALPAGLKGVAVRVSPTTRALAAGPASTTLDARVTPASAQQAVGIQLINPASAAVSAPDEQGLQQAIYFEASDQTP